MTNRFRGTKRVHMPGLDRSTFTKVLNQREKNQKSMQNKANEVQKVGRVCVCFGTDVAEINTHVRVLSNPREVLF